MKQGGTPLDVIDDPFAEPKVVQLHPNGAAPEAGAPAEAPFPDPPSEEVYHGFVGRWVRLAEPFTEADPVAVAGQLLALAGIAFGVRPTFLVGRTEHTPRLFLAIVGASAVARKGDSYQVAAAPVMAAEPAFRARVLHGLVSGEALIHEVRDERPAKPGAKSTQPEDPGVRDKRLVVVEPELARLLRVMGRAGNSLSAVLREAWDNDDLRVAARVSPVRATGCRIGLIGHVTLHELRAELSAMEGSNGFANRFLWLAARRSKVLANPPAMDADDMAEVGRELAGILEYGRQHVERMQRDGDASAAWAETYPWLSRDRGQLLAASILARAPAQVLRLSMIYALLDRSPVIRAEHQAAALALWDYAERSVGYIFPASTGDSVADRILAALRTGPLGREQIRSDVFHRNIDSDRLTVALAALRSAGLVTQHEESTAGRPRTVYQLA